MTNDGVPPDEHIAAASTQRMESRAFLVLLAIVTVAFFALLLDFFAAILWAIVIALLYYPVHERLRKGLGGREQLAAALSVALVALMVIVPAILLGAAVAKQAISIGNDIEGGQFDLSPALTWLSNIVPASQNLLESYGLNVDDLNSKAVEATAAASQYVASKALIVGSGVLQLGLLIFVMLYLLYFLLKDGESIYGAIMSAIPLGNSQHKYLTKRIADVTRATTKGMIVLGLLQGAIGGITFAALSLPGSLLWGVAMAFASLVPVAGTALVWLPAVVILVAIGAPVKAGILFAVGVAVIGMVDNLVRPKLVGQDAEIPDYLVLLSTLGGLSLFGLSGFVAGPVIAAMFTACWGVFSRGYEVPAETVVATASDRDSLKP